MTKFHEYPLKIVFNLEIAYHTFGQFKDRNSCLGAIMSLSQELITRKYFVYMLIVRFKLQPHSSTCFVLYMCYINS